MAIVSLPLRTRCSEDLKKTHTLLLEVIRTIRRRSFEVRVFNEVKKFGFIYWSCRSQKGQSGLRPEPGLDLKHSLVPKHHRTVVVGEEKVGKVHMAPVNEVYFLVR